MRAESWKAIRIPESARAWRRWHASIMPDSSTPATVFPSAARAASRTSATSFHPHDSTKTQKKFSSIDELAALSQQEFLTVGERFDTLEQGVDRLDHKVDAGFKAMTDVLDLIRADLH